MPFERDQAAAYLAGLIDGEGTITYSKNTTGAAVRSRKIGIANTEPALIEAACECCAILGIECLVRSRESQKLRFPKWKPAWDVFIYGRENFKKVQDLVPLRHPAKIKALAEMLGAYRNRIPPSRDELHAAYVVEQMSCSQIAMKFGFKSTASVFQLLKKYEIQARSLSAAGKLNWSQRAI